MKQLDRARGLVAIGAIAIIAGACGGGAATPAPAADAPATTAPTEAPATEAPSAEPMTYKIGYSNAGGVGNGFREEQVCTAKAEALASGMVSELTVIHQNADAAGQLGHELGRMVALRIIARGVEDCPGSAELGALARKLIGHSWSPTKRPNAARQFVAQVRRARMVLATGLPDSRAI